MTLSEQLQLIAGEIGLCAPAQAQRIRECAFEARRMERTLNEIVDDARESAELAERAGVVVAFRRG